MYSKIKYLSTQVLIFFFWKFEEIRVWTFPTCSTMPLFTFEEASFVLSYYYYVVLCKAGIGHILATLVVEVVECLYNMVVVEDVNHFNTFLYYADTVWLPRWRCSHYVKSLFSSCPSWESPIHQISAIEKWITSEQAQRQAAAGRSRRKSHGVIQY